MPEPQAEDIQFGRSQQAGIDARQFVGTAMSADAIKLGGLEVALGTFTSLIAGLVLGLAPGMILQNGPLLALGVPVGLGVGFFGGRFVGKRLTVRGWRLGMAGSLIAAVLVLVLSCNIISTINQSQAISDAYRAEAELAARGYGPPIEPQVTAQVGLSILFQVLGLLALIGVVVWVWRRLGIKIH